VGILLTDPAGFAGLNLIEGIPVAAREQPMTGPEHYKEAERLLSEATARDPHYVPPGGDPGVPLGPPQRDQMIALAQVHATLALAAATAIGDSDQWNVAAE
jgi:hypothetical protein